MDDNSQYFAQAQPHARAALILIAVAAVYAHGIHAAFWFVIAALGCGYLDWMFAGFFMPRASVTAGWLGVMCAACAIASLVWGL